ncbi:hypothetical protein F5880DRAFT_1607620 [Lentinula raphanica]|nr:hypothetical protein F5880DRAFT_1607620 [Lentinula raphanica]
MVHFKDKALAVAILASGLTFVLSVPVSVPDGPGVSVVSVSDKRQTTTGSGMAEALSIPGSQSHTSSSGPSILVARADQNDLRNPGEDAINRWKRRRIEMSLQNRYGYRVPVLEGTLEQLAAGFST